MLILQTIFRPQDYKIWLFDVKRIWQCVWHSAIWSRVTDMSPTQAKRALTCSVSLCAELRYIWSAVVMAWFVNMKSNSAKSEYARNFTICCVLLGRRECLTKRLLHFTKLYKFLVKMVQHHYLIFHVINLVSDIDNQLYQMLLCEEISEIQDWIFQHALLRRNKKQNALQTWHVFIIEVIPHPNPTAAGLIRSSNWPREEGLSTEIPHFKLSNSPRKTKKITTVKEVWIPGLN